MIRISTKSKNFDKKEIKHGNCYLPHVTEDLNKVEPFLQEELDITSESEGLCLCYILLLLSDIANSRSFAQVELYIPCMPHRYY